MTCVHLNNFIFYFYTAYAPLRKRAWERGSPCRKHDIVTNFSNFFFFGVMSQRLTLL